jgi:putative ABC transport system substrate-binding protein
MKRRALLFAACSTAFSFGTLAQSRKVPRVGILHVGSAKEPRSVQREPFEGGLRELGWTPGTTILIDYRYAEGDRSKLPSLAKELVLADVDVIVARADAAINAARAATTTIPIVMAAYLSDAAADGVVASLSRPGGNVTGIGGFIEVDGKRLEILKDAFPSVSRVAVITNPTLEGRKFAERMNNLQSAGGALKLQIQVFEVTRADQIAEAFAAAGKARTDALLIRGDPDVLDTHRAAIAAQAAKLRIPAIYWWPFFVEAGGLMSYGNSLPGLHHRSASYVDRILKGARSADLPIEQPTRMELMVNLKAAKASGIEIPKAIVQRADRIIE